MGLLDHGEVVIGVAIGTDIGIAAMILGTDQAGVGAGAGVGVVHGIGVIVHIGQAELFIMAQFTLVVLAVMIGGIAVAAELGMVPTEVLEADASIIITDQVLELFRVVAQHCQTEVTPT